MTSAEQSSKGLQLILGEIAKSKRAKPLDKLDRAVAYLRAQGEDVKTICDMLDVQPEYVKNLQTHQEFARQVVYIQGALRQSLPDKLRNAAALAYETKLEQMLSSSKPEIRERSATFFLEQEIGKPTQKIQTINMNFNQNSSESLDEKIKATQSRIEQIEQERAKLLNANS